ncbi:MAG: DUF5317 domain-containing protein [Peptococcaceae bacterium]
MFVESLLAGIFVAWVRKGKIKNLGLIQLQRISLLFAVLFVQMIIDLPGVMIPGQIGVIMHIFSYVLLFYFFWINKNRLNSLILTGAALNFSVILFNGSMPVAAKHMSSEAVEQLKVSITHSLLTADTRLAWLADIIYVRWPLRQMLSVGDFLLDIGVFVLIQKVMLKQVSAKSNTHSYGG